MPFVSLRNFRSCTQVPSTRKTSTTIHPTKKGQPKTILVIPTTATTPRKKSREQNMRIFLFVCGPHMQHEISATISNTAAHVPEEEKIRIFKHVKQRKPKRAPPGELSHKHHSGQLSHRRVVQKQPDTDIAHALSQVVCSATQFKLRLQHRAPSLCPTAKCPFRALLAATTAATRQLLRQISLKNRCSKAWEGLRQYIPSQFR